MANPEDVGTFDLWITDRIQFSIAKPKTSDTGDFDRWITDRIPFETYQIAVAVLDERLVSKILQPKRNIQIPIRQLNL